jgi:hypothetical protein
MYVMVNRLITNGSPFDLIPLPGYSEALAIPLDPDAGRATWGFTQLMPFVAGVGDHPAAKQRGPNSYLKPK